jgi:predicted glycosyltransferase
MAGPSTYNILMYSHDTYGLGHIRRTMAIAAQLREPDINILILTGSPIAGRFTFSSQVDFVRIPGMIKHTNEEYRPLSIKIDPRQALRIRKNIITATAKTFRPDLFIVDKEPLGLKKEVLPTLEWLKKYLPGSRSILGLRDVMDDRLVVRRDWEKKGIYRIFGELYDEIWVYGNRDLYDAVAEYAVGDAVSRKFVFTGYIPRKKPGATEVARLKNKITAHPDQKLVLVTTGGGGDGYDVLDTYMHMLESNSRSGAFASILVSGPFMPKDLRLQISARAKRLGIKFYQFYRQMEKLIAAADVVISMGGYNTVCEILTQQTVALMIPRETPRREQLIRAQAMAGRGLVDYIPWHDLTPERLSRRLSRLLEDPEPYKRAIARFPLTGLAVMQHRLALLRDETNQNEK